MCSSIGESICDASDSLCEVVIQESGEERILIPRSNEKRDVSAK